MILDRLPWCKTRHCLRLRGRGWMAVGVLAACVWTRCRFATGELALQPPRPRRSPSYSKLELSLLASAWLGGIATIASSDIARAQSGPFLLARTALAGLVAAVMPTAVRAVMLTIALLAFGNAAQANCDANADRFDIARWKRMKWIGWQRHAVRLRTAEVC